MLSKKKVSFIHTMFFNLEDVSDVKPKESSLIGDLGSFLLGKKVNTFVRHPVICSLCKGAVIYMQYRAQNSVCFPATP